MEHVLRAHDAQHGGRHRSWLQSGNHGKIHQSLSGALSSTTTRALDFYSSLSHGILTLLANSWVPLPISSNLSPKNFPVFLIGSFSLNHPSTFLGMSWKPSPTFFMLSWRP